MANEKRLIDAHTLKRRMIKAMEISKVLKITQDDFVFCIDNSETVDAVEVVRCKDCRHYRSTNDGGLRYCGYTMMGRCTKTDDFCSYGERKEDGKE